MMRHVVARAPARIELLQTAVKKAQQPLRPCPVRNVGILAKHDGKNVGDRAPLDHERAVHIGLAEFELGIEENSPLGRAGGKAHPYGWPVPSPKVKTVPREVVTLNVPRWTKVLSRNRSKRSIGRLRQVELLATLYFSYDAADQNPLISIN